MSTNIQLLMEIIKTLGREARAAREKRQLTLKEVARSGGFSTDHLWKFESGNLKNISVLKLAQIAEANGMKLVMGFNDNVA